MVNYMYMRFTYRENHWYYSNKKDDVGHIIRPCEGGYCIYDDSSCPQKLTNDCTAAFESFKKLLARFYENGGEQIDKLEENLLIDTVMGESITPLISFIIDGQ